MIKKRIVVWFSRLNIRDNIYSFVAFVVGSMCMFLVLLLSGLLPNSSYSLMSGDLGDLTIPLIRDFCRSIINGETPFYSWSQYLGMNQSFYCAYCGLLSPFTLLYLFFPKTNPNILIAICLVVKTGLASLAFQLFSRFAFRRNDCFSVLFSICYSMCSFQVACNVTNILWMDALYILPIVFLAIYILAKTGNAVLLYISYSYIFCVQFYMGYMIGILSFIFFVCGIWFLHKEISPKKYIISYLASTIAAILTSAFVWCPAAYYILHQYPEDATAFSDFVPNLISVYSQLFFSNNPSQTTMLPSLYCGSIVLLLFPAFFFFSKKKERLLYGIPLFLLLAACVFLPMYKIIHAFDFPDEWYYRFSYLISFLLCVIALKTMEYLDSLRTGYYLLVLSINAFVCFLNVLFFQEREYKWFFGGITVALLIMWIVLILFITKGQGNNHLPNSILLLICIFFTGVECIANGCVWRYSTDNIKSWDDNKVFLTWRNNQEIIKDELSDDDSFYRVQYIDAVFNSDLYGGYYNLSDFGTAENEKVRSFLSNMGLATSPRVITPYGTTEITNMLLGVKYKIDPYYEIMDNGDLVEKIKIENVPHRLGLGYMVNEDVNKIVFTEDAFINNNNVLSGLTGMEIEAFEEKPVAMQIESGGISLEKDAEGFIFFTDENVSNPEMKMIVDDEEDNRNSYIYFLNDKSLFADNSMFIVGNDENMTPFGGRLSSSYIRRFDLIGEKSGIVIFSGDCSVMRVRDIRFAHMNENAISQAYEYLAKNQLEITAIKRGYLKGRISVPQDKNILFTTIPYEKGWELFVNGKKYSYFSLVDGTFIGVEFPEAGEYEIEMRFTPMWLREGVVLSILGIGLYVLFFCLKRKRCKFMR